MAWKHAIKQKNNNGYSIAAALKDIDGIRENEQSKFGADDGQ